jgi:porphobilinogen synthase
MGLPGIMLFGIPQIKDEKGSGAYSREGIAQKALKSIKEETGDDLIIIADLCLCGYTAHGHCGLFNGSEVLNDETLELYGMIAVSQAEAGADIVAPSGMMDGMVRAIRMALDDSGFNEVLILSYSAKFCSSFFEPFRDVMDSHPTEMGRETYQLDPGNLREALREVQLDVDEGADIVMVKPAMPYLDVIREVRRRFDLPIAAYQVSGEHALLKAGIIDYEKALMESLTSIRRAGADMIITYGAMDAAGIMKRQA